MSPSDDRQSPGSEQRPSSAPDFGPGTTASGHTGPSQAPGADPERTVTNAELEAHRPLQRDAPTAPPVAAAPAAGAGAGAGAARNPTPAQMIAGRFLVRRMLGEGGMGRVYAVQDKQIEGRDVALKVLLPKYSRNEQFKRLFFQEVKAAQKFVSEYVCQVRDTGEAEEGLFLTMDLVEGESLRALLDREKVLAPRHALEITRQVLKGLQSGHEKGFIHRDIKPSNVMLVARVPKTDANPYGVGARLLDFGIAGLAAEIGEKSRAGTVMYMSPEQAGGERLDPRSDLFAVGVLLFEMLSGRRPFEGATTQALVQSVIQTNITERLNEIPNLQKPIRRLLERALQKDRDKRFQSAGEFAEAIGKSEAYKIPKEVPAWAYVGLVVLGGSAGFLAFRSLGFQERVDGLNTQIASLKAEVEAASGKVATARQEAEIKVQGDVRELQRLKQEAEERALGADKSRGEWEARFNEQKALREKIEREVGDERVRQEQDLKWKEESERKYRELKEQFDRSDIEKKNLERDFGQLKEENRSLRLQSQPEGRMAETFDAMMASIESGRGDNALAQLAEATKKFSVFLSPELDGTTFLQTLAQTSADIRVHSQRLNEQGVPDFAAVSRAEVSFRSCEDAFRTFASDAKAWLGFKIGQEAPDRMALATKVVDGLRRQLGEVAQAARKAHDGAWAAIDLEAAVTAPDAVFEHVATFRCADHMASAASRLVERLRADAVANGALALEPLRKFTRLADWTARLDAKEFTLRPDQETDLRLFELAQRWYDADTNNDAMSWARVQLPPLTQASSDWRYVLQTQWRLELDGESFPIRAGRTLLFKQSTPKVPTSWRQSSSTRSRLAFTSTDFDEFGRQLSEPDEAQFEFKDHQLRVAGSSLVLVDLLSRDANVRVVPFPVPPSGLIVPPALVEDQDLARFRDALGTKQLHCLVVKKSNRELWLSPEYGLVGDVFEGQWRRELVFATLVP